MMTKYERMTSKRKSLTDINVNKRMKDNKESCKGYGPKAMYRMDLETNITTIKPKLPEPDRSMPVEERDTYLLIATFASVLILMGIAMAFMHRNCRYSLNRWRMWLIHLRHRNTTSVRNSGIRRVPSSVNLMLDLRDPNSPLYSKEVHVSPSVKFVDNKGFDSNNNNDEDGEDSGISVISSSRDGNASLMPSYRTGKLAQNLSQHDQWPSPSYSPIPEPHLLSAFYKPIESSHSERKFIRQNDDESATSKCSKPIFYLSETDTNSPCDESQYKTIVPTMISYTGSCNSDRGKPNLKPPTHRGGKFEFSIDAFQQDEDMQIDEYRPRSGKSGLEYNRRMKTSSKNSTSSEKMHNKAPTYSVLIPGKEDCNESYLGHEFDSNFDAESFHLKLPKKEKVHILTKETHSGRKSDKASGRRKGNDNAENQMICKEGNYDEFYDTRGGDVLKPRRHGERRYRKISEENRGVSSVSNIHQTNKRYTQSENIPSKMKHDPDENSLENVLPSFQSFGQLLKNRRRRLSRDTAIDQSDSDSENLRQSVITSHSVSIPLDIQTRRETDKLRSNLGMDVHHKSVSDLRPFDQRPVLSVDEILRRKRKGRKLPPTPSQFRSKSN